MGALLAVLFTVATAGIVGGAIVLTRRATAARAAGLSEVATRLGWGYREEVPFKMIPDLDRFELFRTGSSKKLRNLMTSPAGEVRAVVFDYSYTISTGKSQQVIRQTVFYATGDDLDLPTFSLRPEHFFHRVAGAFGYQDIDLEHRPEFSRLFLLRGEDETRLREAFNDAVVEFFEAREGMCAAGAGRELLYWRPRRVAAPEDIETLIRDGRELSGRFVHAG